MEDKICKVDKATITFAMRYALGRQTFAPSMVIENIKHNIELFNSQDMKMLIRDIDYQASFGYGMQCDTDTWMNFKAYLEDKIASQETF